MFKKFIQRVQILTKTLHNLHICVDADCDKDNLSRLRFYFTTAGTQMLCQYMLATYYNPIFLKRPCLSVVFGPRNVLRVRHVNITM